MCSKIIGRNKYTLSAYVCVCVKFSSFEQLEATIIIMHITKYFSYHSNL